MVADASRRRFEAVVVVNLLGDSARALFSAFREQRITHDVIESQHALGAGYPLYQALDFGIVNRLDLIGIVKVLDRSFVLGEDETVGVERELTQHLAAVVYRDASLDVF